MVTKAKRLRSTWTSGLTMPTRYRNWMKQQKQQQQDSQIGSPKTRARTRCAPAIGGTCWSVDRRACVRTRPRPLPTLAQHRLLLLLETSMLAVSRGHSRVHSKKTSSSKRRRWDAHSSSTTTVWRVGAPQRTMLVAAHLCWMVACRCVCIKHARIS